MQNQKIQTIMALVEAFACKSVMAAQAKSEQERDLLLESMVNYHTLIEANLKELAKN